MLMREQGADPFGGPRAFIGAVDSRKRVEGDGAAALAGMTAVFAAKSERMMCAAHRQHGGARRKALVEDIDLGVRVAPELQDQQRQQHGFTGAGRPDDQHMADIANMGRKPERYEERRGGKEWDRTGR